MPKTDSSVWVTTIQDKLRDLGGRHLDKTDVRLVFFEQLTAAEPALVQHNGKSHKLLRLGHGAYFGGRQENGSTLLVRASYERVQSQAEDILKTKPAVMVQGSPGIGKFDVILPP
jgi:hypothetical protein